MVSGGRLESWLAYVQSRLLVFAVHYGKKTGKIFHKHLWFFLSSKVWLFSPTALAVALYMLRISELSFLSTDVQIRIGNSVIYIHFLHKTSIEGKFRNMNASLEFVIIRLFSHAFCLWHWQHWVTLLAFLSSTILLFIIVIVSWWCSLQKLWGAD